MPQIDLEFRPVSSCADAPEHVAEYAALSRLAEVTVEFDERVADD